jgi:phenylpropionate dioxygenase-like ring-hydroxylating dioxygenase large terminal subunit
MLNNVGEPTRYQYLVQDDRIHASLYTDPRIFAEEMEKIFYQGWVFVGHDSEAPQPGDFVTRHIGTQPILMVRGKAGNVSVLLNRCAHRGTAVCPAERCNARVFTCPYHGWTYDLNGALLGVPYPTGYNGVFDKKANGLTHAPRVANYRGFVFASFSPTGISLEEHLGAATQLIDRACDLSPEGEIELTAGWVKHRYPANWKMLPENDTDGYHLGFVHQSMLKAVGSQYQRFVGDEKSIKAVLRDWGNGHTEIWATAPRAPEVSKLSAQGRASCTMEITTGKQPPSNVSLSSAACVDFPKSLSWRNEHRLMQLINVEECSCTPMFSRRTGLTNDYCDKVRPRCPASFLPS